MMSDTVRCQSCGDIIELSNSHLIKDVIRLCNYCFKQDKNLQRITKPNNNNASTKNQLTIEGINTILKNMDMRLKIETIVSGD